MKTLPASRQAVCPDCENIITHFFREISEEVGFLYNYIMKALNFIFFLVFLFSAVLQYNDPDPYIWIHIYMYGAILCWLAFRDKYYPKAYLIGIVLYSIYAIGLFFWKDGVLDWITKYQAEDIAATMKAEKPWIEETREFFGLVILIVVLLINYFYTKRKPVN